MTKNTANRPVSSSGNPTESVGWTAVLVGEYHDLTEAYALVDPRGKERTYGPREEIQMLAAAPDLLAACELVLNDIDDLLTRRTVLTLRAAIAKAKGGAA